MEWYGFAIGGDIVHRVDFFLRILHFQHFRVKNGTPDPDQRHDDLRVPGLRDDVPNFIYFSPRGRSNRS